MDSQTAASSARFFEADFRTTYSAAPLELQRLVANVHVARDAGPIRFDGGSLSLGTLVLLDAGLYSPASSRYPSGGGIGAIIGPCIEGNRRAWGSLTNSVDDDFE